MHFFQNISNNINGDYMNFNSLNKRNIDYKIIIPLIIFCIISVTSIYSSSELLSIHYNNLFIKQIIWYCIGFILIKLIMKIDLEVIFKHINILYIIGNVLLALVLIFGTQSNGAKCWFSIPGIGSFQPSEFVKIILILMLAKELNKYEKSKKNFINEFKIILRCLIITLIPSILIFLEPDTGMIFIFFSILIIMLFIYGIRYRWFAIMLSITLIFLIIFFTLFFNYQETFINLFGTNFFYRIDRLLDWKNGSGMQLTNALAANGSAGLFGYGFRKTPIYFPEPHTDFIFSVFCSNFGFILSMLLILTIAYFDFRIIHISSNLQLKYKLILIGIFAMLLFQQIQNIGMNIGLLPITGITLPFISYGGSSLISYMILIGIILNIQRKYCK